MRFGLRELIFMLVLLAVPAGAYYFVFRAQQDDIRTIEQRNAMMLEKLQRLRDVTARVPDIQTEIDRGQQAIELVEAKLPAQQDVEQVLEQVWQLAERNSQKVRSVKTQSAVPAASYMELSIDVVMEGQFNGFYQFLLELEELPRITRIHDMELVRAGFAESGGRSNKRKRTQTSMSSASADELPPGTMRAEFTLSIYFERSDNFNDMEPAS
ncbi:MAG: type 4a pilus biogenesis protein PilO [Phycisphaerales bacterium]|nr:type 4a pilus biogenesis protein PilO [Phycisphaerales bacterium]